jgi:PAS domain S-box-containing protein
MGALEFGGLPGMGVATALPGLLNQAGVAMAALDGHGHLTMVSPGLESVTGRTAEAIPAAALAEAFQLHTDGGRRLLEPDEVPLVRARAGETVRDALITTKRPDGSLRYLRCNAMPVPAAAGDYRGAVTFVEDVTEAPAGSPTYEQLRAGIMIWLNHELRTPLATLLGHVELLTEADLELPEQATRSLAAMARATDRLTTFAETLTALGNAGGDGLPDAVVRPIEGGVNASVFQLPGTDATTAAYRTSCYSVYPTGFDEVADPGRRHWVLRVEDAGDGWAARWRSRCLNYRREWEFEPPAKSRTNDFLRRCRFSERAAILRAQQAVDQLLVDGKTFSEFVQQVRADATARARAALESGEFARPEDLDVSRPVLPLSFRFGPPRVRNGSPGPV